MRKKDKFAYVKVERTEGADGEITCWCRTVVLTDIANQATEFTDFLPTEEKLVFAHQETEKMLKIELSQTATMQEEEEKKESVKDFASNDSESAGEEEQMLVFQVKLYNPEPRGTKLSRK